MKAYLVDTPLLKMTKAFSRYYSSYDEMGLDTHRDTINVCPVPSHPNMNALAEVCPQIRLYPGHNWFIMPATETLFQIGGPPVQVPVWYEHSCRQSQVTISVSTPCSFLTFCCPCPRLGLHLDPKECQMAIRWWLGMDTSGGDLCTLCPGSVHVLLGHHTLTCKHGEDVVTRHNKL